MYIYIYIFFLSGINSVLSSFLLLALFVFSRSNHVLRTYNHPQTIIIIITVIIKEILRSNYLPKNWLSKASKANVNDVQIMTEEGEQVESYLAAIEIIEARPEFGKEDVERVNALIAQHTETWVTANEVKLEEDLSTEVKPNETERNR